MYYFNYLFELLWSGLSFPLNGSTVKISSGNKTALILRSLFPAVEDSVYLAVLET